MNFKKDGREKYSRTLLKQYRLMQKQGREGITFSEAKAEQFISELRELIKHSTASNLDYKLLEAS